MGRTYFFICVVLTAYGSLFSQEAENIKSEKSIRFLLEAGLEYGGDELLKVFFTNGENQVMKAGQGGLLAAGLSLKPTSLQWLELRATIGLKANTTAADNANIFFIRYPANFLAFVAPINDIRIGGGVTKHVGASLNGDGYTPDQSYTSPMGLRMELGYKGLSLSYNNVTYVNNQILLYGGSSIGIAYSYLF